MKKIHLYMSGRRIEMKICQNNSQNHLYMQDFKIAMKKIHLYIQLAHIADILLKQRQKISSNRPSAHNQ